MKTSAAIISGIILLSISSRAQTPFQNLGFESSQVADVYDPSHIFTPFSQALPGWTGYFGTNLANQAVVNTVSLGKYNISILGHNALVYGPIAGNWSAVIQAGFEPFQPALSATLAQTGFVPAGTLSLQMKVRPNTPGDLNNMLVTLGGQTITMLPLGTDTNYPATTLFAGDISQFANQTAELRITVLSLPPGANSTLELDNIVFSPHPVPEPAIPALALLALVWRRRAASAPGPLKPWS
jgi:hypothetical protein